MTKSLKIIAIAIAFGAAGGAWAQTRLPDIMQQAAEARSGVGDAAKSPWRIEKYGDVPGKGCSLYFLDGPQTLVIVGPNQGGNITEDPNESIALLSGPNIPAPKGGQIGYQKVTVKNGGNPDRSVKAILAPSVTGSANAGTVLLYMKTIDELLSGLKDTGSLGIDIDKKSVVNFQWSNAGAELGKLRDCVAGKTG
jgi:hypothetical protein